MAGFRVTKLSVDSAGKLLQIAPTTVRRRVRVKELRKEERPGREFLVVFDPARDTLRAEDAAAILGVSPATVRAAITSGELVGVKDKKGRWRVRLESVLADPRAHPEVVALFTGEQLLELEQEPPPPARVGRLRRDVFLRIDEGAETELLERAIAQHGTLRAAVVAGLAALAEETMGELEAAELLADRDVHRDRAERAEARARGLAELVRERTVEELYCPHCDRLVPIAECDYELDGEQIELYHRKHGHHRGSRLRASTIVARRRVRLDDEEK